jgi:hypothetical protein
MDIPTLGLSLRDRVSQADLPRRRKGEYASPYMPSTSTATRLQRKPVQASPAQVEIAHSILKDLPHAEGLALRDWYTGAATEEELCARLGVTGGRVPRPSRPNPRGVRRENGLDSPRRGLLGHRYAPGWASGLFRPAERA